MTGTTHYAPYRRADATQDIFIVVGFCMLMFLSGMVVALMLIAEYEDYVRRTNHTTVKKNAPEHVLEPASTRTFLLGNHGRLMKPRKGERAAAAVGSLSHRQRAKTTSARSRSTKMLMA
ncbi:uncharacterized protein [Dermacentor albipictus]|uniref:uncharacterized protein n=1 Tax=Dermacentor albipictus TaxID=60249 RepID=UPI0031FBDF64